MGRRATRLAFFKSTDSNLAFLRFQWSLIEDGPFQFGHQIGIKFLLGTNGLKLLQVMFLTGSIMIPYFSAFLVEMVKVFA